MKFRIKIIQNENNMGERYISQVKLHWWSRWQSLYMRERVLENRCEGCIEFAEVVDYEMAVWRCGKFKAQYKGNTNVSYQKVII